MDLVLNNLQWLICHESKPNHIKPNFKQPIQLRLSVEEKELPNQCPGYGAKQSDGEALVLALWGIWNIPSQPLLQDPLSPGLIVSVMVQSVGQIELCNHLLYLKPFNCVQTDDQIYIELLLLDCNS